MVNTRQKEAARKKFLGELGELVGIKVLVDLGFDKIKNINDTKLNERFADLYCEKDDKRFVISVKTRNKYTKNGKLNSSYNLGTNAYDKAQNISSKYKAEPYWMAIQFDSKEYSIYFGSLECLNSRKSIPIVKCENGECGEILIKNKRHFFDFSHLTNRKN